MNSAAGAMSLSANRSDPLSMALSDLKSDVGPVFGSSVRNQPLRTQPIIVTEDLPDNASYRADFFQTSVSND
jgi:hypothetical protein